MLKRKDETIAAHCCSGCSPWSEERQDLNILYEQLKPPSLRASYNLSVTADCSPVQKRQWQKSFCLFHKLPPNEELLCHEKRDGYLIHWETYPDSVRPYEFTNNCKGEAGRVLMTLSAKWKIFKYKCMHTLSYLILELNKNKAWLKEVWVPVAGDHSLHYSDLEDKVWKIMRQTKCFRLTNLKITLVLLCGFVMLVATSHLNHLNTY